MVTTILQKTRPALHFQNAKKGGVGKTLLSKLKAAYLLENELSFTAVDADPQRSFYKAHPDFVVESLFSELDRYLKISDRTLDYALRQLTLVDLPGNCEPEFHFWLEERDALSLADDVGIKVQNWYVLDGSTETYEGFLRTLDVMGTEKVQHILVLNLGRNDDWEELENHVPNPLLHQTNTTLFYLPKLTGDIADVLYKTSMSFTDARRYQGFSIAQLAGLRRYLNKSYEALEAIGFSLEALKA